MNTPTISLSALQKATALLANALAQEYNEFTRDATIQRFEYTYELSWKTLKRYLSQYTGSQEHNIKALFREAAQQKLIADPQPWFGYHQARNLTSHTYHEATAEEAYQAAKAFLIDAQQLLNTLKTALETNAN